MTIASTPQTLAELHPRGVQPVRTSVVHAPPGAAHTDPFDDVPIGGDLQRSAAFFGVSALKYFAWIVDSDSLGPVVDVGWKDLDKLCDAHLDLIRMKWPHITQSSTSEVPEVPLEPIRRTVVGKVIKAQSMGGDLDKEALVRRSVSDVASQLKRDRPELDTTEARTIAQQAIEYILTTVRE